MDQNCQSDDAWNKMKREAEESVEKTKDIFTEVRKAELAALRKMEQNETPSDTEKK
jgi:hypothetical protein